MNKPEEFEVECPHCGENNSIPRPAGWVCQKCNQPLGAGRYGHKLISPLTALLLGIGGTIGARELMTTERYPIAVEHAIIEACIDPSRKPMTYDFLRQKRKVCICALEKTQDDFEADEARIFKSNSKFLDAFEANVLLCAIGD
ncbi:MAG: hypothetical protein OQJ98_03250 [Candidatus Pacebacteria bacterium]|nr:hypothetical protein [Candidatus Paceibacterota bacterium]